jgi:hypothetical protein
MDQSTKRRIELPILLALVAILVMSFSSALPIAHAWNGNEHHSQNQVSIDSITHVGNTLVVKVSATIKADNHDDHGWNNNYRQVRFTLTASYGSHPLDPRNDGTQFFRDQKTADLTKRSNGEWYAQTTFTVPFKGVHYYLFQLDARAGSNWIGSDWVDPIEGTAG